MTTGTPRVGESARTPTAGTPERDAVRQMFDRIAPRYDLLNRVLSARQDVRWRRRCVDALGLPAGSRVLDLCTGTGDLLLEWLGRDPRNRGEGVDLAGGMLGVGRRKLGRAIGSGRGGLAQGDSMRLPFVGECFDGAMVAFGIRNVADPGEALSEVARVLRPGCPLVILEFGVPRGVLGRAYRLYFSRVLPRIGGWVSGDAGAYTYLPQSVGRWLSPEGLARLMEESGFRRVTRHRLSLGIAWLHRGTTGDSQ